MVLLETPNEVLSQICLSVLTTESRPPSRASINAELIRQLIRFIFPFAASERFHRLALDAWLSATTVFLVVTDESIFKMATTFFSASLSDYLPGGIGGLSVLDTVFYHITRLDCVFDVERDAASLAILTTVCPNVRQIRVWLLWVSINNDRTPLETGVSIVRNLNIPNKNVTRRSQFLAPDLQTEPDIDATTMSDVQVAAAMVDECRPAF